MIHPYLFLIVFLGLPLPAPKNGLTAHQFTMPLRKYWKLSTDSKKLKFISDRTNVPDIAMSFSDIRFPYGPYPPHWVPRHYIANYFSAHRTDSFLVLDTTLEDLSRISVQNGNKRWKLTLRRYDAVRHVDLWWEEEYDAVVLANGHYSVPFVSQLMG